MKKPIEVYLYEVNLPVGNRVKYHIKALEACQAEVCIFLQSISDQNRAGLIAVLADYNQFQFTKLKNLSSQLLMQMYGYNQMHAEDIIEAVMTCDYRQHSHVIVSDFVGGIVNSTHMTIEIYPRTGLYSLSLPSNPSLN